MAAEKKDVVGAYQILFISNIMMKNGEGQYMTTGCFLNF
jgi:hypothetical protein